MHGSYLDVSERGWYGDGRSSYLEILKIRSMALLNCDEVWELDFRVVKRPKGLEIDRNVMRRNPESGKTAAVFYRCDAFYRAVRSRVVE